MTIKVKQNLVSSSKYSIKCPHSMDAEYITFHNTANDASAENEISYMLNNNNQVSYHFAVDDKEVIQGVPVNRNAWHCGDGNGNGNRKSIGVEVCYSKSGGEKYEKAEKNAIQLIAQLLHERNWGIDRVKRHQEWSGKYCPHRVLAEGRWDEVLDRISAALKALKGEIKESIKVVEPVQEEVKSVITKTPSKATDESYVGKRVESIYKGSEGLNFYSKASWDKKYKVGTVAYGVGFPTIVDKVKVDGSDMYKVKNSKGTVYYITAASEYVKVEGETTKKTTTAKTEVKKTTTSSNPSTIKSVGKIKIVGVSAAAIIMDKADRNNSKNVGTIAKGKTIAISGSVKGKNNDKGYWEVIYNSKRCYISGQYGEKI
ncbi:N-acetylmuramoyl-L-alanine amidase family protein [Niallia taxi]|uniref:peptidoglycan recognition protein family protein n=1 Tax=Niallia taxi TaxID=2499688 RepID=UPI0031708A8C